jgi:hypothetical protein
MKYLVIILGLSLLISCFSEQKESVSEITPLTHSEVNHLVSEVFDSLSKTLHAAIREGGFEGAVKFCSLEAINITKHSWTEGIEINRRSHRNRNPLNMADSLAQIAIQQFIKMPSEEWSNQILEFENSYEVRYFKPIVLMPQCTPCHGAIGVTIPEHVAVKIAEKYPDDLATGFEIGQLRGVWEIIQKK